MRLVEIKKTAIETTTEDWKKLHELYGNFFKICTNYSNCEADCPFYSFCKDHVSPAVYFNELIKYLDA